jgi:hypothetical protein
MKIAVLLFDRSHFSQVSQWLRCKKKEKYEIVVISLDPYSLSKIKKYGYNFIYPDYKLKEEIRKALFIELPQKIQEWANVEIDNGLTIQNYLRIDSIDIWDIVKNIIGISLFEKMYFVKLVRRILLEIAPDRLIIPPLPSKITLCYLTIIRRRTIVALAESLGITVEGGKFPRLTSLFMHSLGQITNLVRNIFLSFWKREIKNPIYNGIFNKNISPKQNADNKKKKILIWADFSDFKPGSIMPILSALKSKNYECKMLIDRNNKIGIFNRLKQKNISFIFTNEYKDINLNKSRIVKILDSYNKKWSTFKKSKRNKKLFSYYSISLWDNEYQDIKNFISPKNIMNIFKNYKLVRHLLQSEKPDLLIFPDDQKIIGRICAKVAGEEGIPSLCIPYEVDNLLENTPIFDLLKYGKYAVTGKGMLNLLERQGLSIKNLIVTGSAYWDIHFQITPKHNKDKIYKILNLDIKKQNIFLFTMQDGLPENKEVLRIMINAMQHFPNRYLIIKAHPNSKDSKISYISYIKRLGLKNIVFTEKFDFWSIASISEIILTIYSLTGFEAMLLNKPVITINLTCYPDFMPYVRYGAALGIYKEEDLIPAIEKILSDSLTKERLKEGRKRIIEDYAYKLDGKATERITELILNLLKNGRIFK